MKISIDYLAATHANEMTGVYVHALLSDIPLPPDLSRLPVYSDETTVPGVRSRIANYLALEIGGGALRSLREPQLQARYCDNNPAAEENEFAALNVFWVGSNAFKDNAVVIDDHANHTPDLNFARVGSLASKRSIAAAHILGFDKFVVMDDSFTDTIFTAVIVDQYVPDDTRAYIATARARYEGLVRLAAETTESLDEHYELNANSLSFYRVIEIRSLDDRKKPSSYLGELETIKVENAFTPLELTCSLREQLGIQDHELPMSQTWGYNNMSRMLDTSGRRLYFGGIFCQIDQPEPDRGIWVRQQGLSEERWRKP